MLARLGAAGSCEAGAMSITEQELAKFHEYASGRRVPTVAKGWMEAVGKLLNAFEAAEADRDSHQRVAIKALERAEQAEAERDWLATELARCHGEELRCLKEERDPRHWIARASAESQKQ